MEEDLTDAQIQEMISLADMDGDGEINEQEFMRIFKVVEAHGRL